MCIWQWSWSRTNSFYYCLGVSGLPKLLIFFILLLNISKLWIILLSSNKVEVRGVTKVVIGTPQEFKVQEMFAGIFYNCDSHIKVFVNNPSIFQASVLRPVVPELNSQWRHLYFIFFERLSVSWHIIGLIIAVSEYIVAILADKNIIIKQNIVIFYATMQEVILSSNSSVLYLSGIGS